MKKSKRIYKSSITGPERVSGKFHKTPEVRDALCIAAAGILAGEEAGNFQTFPAGGSDAKAFWNAIPERHKRRGKRNVRQISRAARRVFSWYFLCEGLHER